MYVCESPFFMHTGHAQYKRVDTAVLMQDVCGRLYSCISHYFMCMYESQCIYMWDVASICFGHSVVNVERWWQIARLPVEPYTPASLSATGEPTPLACVCVCEREGE